MGKLIFKPNPKVTAVFEHLEQYLDFCQTHGYRYNEADLYNWKSYSYQQFNKFVQGKAARDMWAVDNRRGR